MPLSLTQLIFVVSGLAALAFAALCLSRALRSGDAVALRKEPDHATRGTEIVWALVPLLILGLVLASLLQVGSG